MNNKLIVGSALALILLSWIGIYIIYKDKSYFENQLQAEAKKNSALQSENKSLENSLANDEVKLQEGNNKIFQLSGENEKLNKKINAQETQISQLARNQKKFASELEKVPGLKKENLELQGLLNKSREQLSQLEMERKKLESENERLRAENSAKDTELLSLRLIPDQVAVEGTRGKNSKIVVRAGRVQRLKLSFESTAALKDLEFKISGPNGMTFPTSETNPVFNVESENIMNSKTPRKIEMTYKTPKLKPGIYNIEIRAKNAHVASFKIKFR
jgi:hypothetical protein